ncbi:hypothetical protein Tsubulata_007549 [Turnera subulata]|uniref:Kinetochore protein Nuf2 N-terminal domain-containing protein n=1 Tax=Turnera subulata TaxID=218843 RepID=A0A9Q0EYC1_9ROSI|nr:hypothetical protein Tsubulata_007549 [Turnera subulata]
MSKFEYPKLSRTELMTILAESQIMAVIDSDLKNPTRDFVADLYTRLLINLDLLPEEDEGQMEFGALEKLENPEHHMVSTRVVNLYVRVKQVLIVLACPWKFSMRDILRPQGDRTELFLSVLLNFLLHRDTKMNFLRPIWEELTQLEEKRCELEAKISQLNEEIADLKVARESELPVVEELDAKVKELRQKIAGLNSHQVSLKASYKKLKDKAAAMDVENQNAEFDLIRSAQENANLRSKIVQSPEKLQRALEEKKSVREEAKNAERSAMQTFQERTSVLDLYTKVHKKLSKHYAQMQAIQEQVDSAKSIERELKSLKTKQREDVVVDRSLDAKLVELQGKGRFAGIFFIFLFNLRDPSLELMTIFPSSPAQSLNNLRKVLEKESDLECEAAAKEYNSVASEMESRRRDLETRQRRVDAVLAEVDAIHSETNSVKESASAKVQELVHRCEIVVKEFRQYKDSVAILLQKFEEEKHLLQGVTVR